MGGPLRGVGEFARGGRGGKEGKEKKWEGRCAV